MVRTERMALRRAKNNESHLVMELLRNAMDSLKRSMTKNVIIIRERINLEWGRNRRKNRNRAFIKPPYGVE
jgi:hypothetical protein